MIEKEPARSSFRSDINGLRAWAVAAVVLYHFGVPGFGGGFVGVDVFFVISGFLMTGIVVSGLEKGNFSILGFYMARARRIVPALLVLCSVLLVVGWWWLPAADYKSLGAQAASGLAFLSNYKFWIEAGYFDVSSHEKWLLHTWSLSVEWQFYLILPVVLWTIWQFNPGRLVQIWTLSVGFVASLAASVWVTNTQPSTAFYLLHTRAWEMMAGGLVFLLGSNIKISALRRIWMETAGLLLIAMSIAIFSKDTHWPSWWAIVPVTGAVFILLSRRNSPWTGSKLSQWLGDRSYSLYLWHWPLVVLLNYVSLKANPFATLLALIFTCVLGHLSYIWVERKSKQIFDGLVLKHSILGLVSMASFVMLVGATIWLLKGVPTRFPFAVEVAAAESQNFNQRTKECFLETGFKSPLCVFGGKEMKAMAVGDSHVSAVISAIALDKTNGVLWLAHSGCVFVPGLKISNAGELGSRGEAFQCSEFINWAELTISNAPKNIPIILIGRYALAAFGANKDDQRDIPEVYFTKQYVTSTSEFLTEFAAHVTDGACELAKQHEVYMMRPIPEMGFDVPRRLSRKIIMGANDDLHITIDSYRKRNDWVWAAQDAAHDRCGIKILNPIPFLCQNGRCYGSKNGRPLYFDDNHLSEFGNKLIAPMFEKIFNKNSS